MTLPDDGAVISLAHLSASQNFAKKAAFRDPFVVKRNRLGVVQGPLSGPSLTRRASQRLI
jgi:hypothetical protein